MSNSIYKYELTSIDVQAAEAKAILRDIKAAEAIARYRQSETNETRVHAFVLRQEDADEAQDTNEALKNPASLSVYSYVEQQEDEENARDIRNVLNQTSKLLTEKVLTKKDKVGCILYGKKEILREILQSLSDFRENTDCIMGVAAVPVKYIKELLDVRGKMIGKKCTDSNSTTCNNNYEMYYRALKVDDKKFIYNEFGEICETSCRKEGGYSGCLVFRVSPLTELTQKPEFINTINDIHESNYLICPLYPIGLPYKRVPLEWKRKYLSEYPQKKIDNMTWLESKKLVDLQIGITGSGEKKDKDGLDCCIREVKEETGITLRRLNLVPVLDEAS
tara:strand:+ start:1090 stop:2091 length:1002 start_codon:yes stop_codon:yes gene_type:complete